MAAPGVPLDLFVDSDSPVVDLNEAKTPFASAKHHRAKKGSLLSSRQPLTGSVCNTPAVVEEVATPVGKKGFNGIAGRGVDLGLDLSSAPLRAKLALVSPESRIWQELDRGEFAGRLEGGVFPSIPEEDVSTPAAKPAPMETMPEPVPSSSEPYEPMEWDHFDVGDFSCEGGVSAEMQDWVNECAIRDSVSTETVWKELEEEAVAYMNQIRDHKRHAQEAEEAEKQQWLKGIPCELPADEDDASSCPACHPCDWDSSSSRDSRSQTASPPPLPDLWPLFSSEIPSASLFDVPGDLAAQSTVG